MFYFSEYKLVGTGITLHSGKNAFKEWCVRGEAYIHRHVTDVFVILMLVKREVFEFIIPRGTKNWILLGELRQDFIEVFMMHKTEMPLVNVEKYVQKEGIKMRMNF